MTIQDIIKCIRESSVNERAELGKVLSAMGVQVVIRVPSPWTRQQEDENRAVAKAKDAIDPDII